MPVSTHNPNYFGYCSKFFKREIDEDGDKRLIPISFCIPKEKIVPAIPEKKYEFSYITPGGSDSSWPRDARKTFIYEEETKYYQDYKESYFGLTCKKGGWDCMRHVEILANGCVPIFTDLEWCPQRTLTFYPKSYLCMIKTIPGLKLVRINNTEKPIYRGQDIIQGASCLTDEFCFDSYLDYCGYLLEYTRKNLTTEALGKYIIEK